MKSKQAANTLDFGGFRRILWGTGGEMVEGRGERNKDRIKGKVKKNLCNTETYLFLWHGESLQMLPY